MSESTPPLSSSISAAAPQSSLMPPVTPATDVVVAMDSEMQNWDNNLGALCQHVQADGWNAGSFSDVVVQAMGSTFYLHRLLLSRSSYFRHMLQGPWREAGKPEVTLHIDDENVNAEAISAALAYLYGVHPQLDDSNAFRVLAAASFLDLQDLCALCTDFIISELWTENFLGYQAFVESQDYGVHGERVRKACWGYLCRGGAVELREILPKLSFQTLRNLLTSDELWVPSEEKRFELALSVLVARGGLLELNSSQVPNLLTNALEGDFAIGTKSSSLTLIKTQEQIQFTNVDGCNFLPNTGVDAHKVACSTSAKSTDQTEVNTLIQSTILELADSLVAMQDNDPSCAGKKEQFCVNQQMTYPYGSEKYTLTDKLENSCEAVEHFSESFKKADVGYGEACATNELPVEDSLMGHMGSDDIWSYRDHTGHCSPSTQPSTSFAERSSSNDSNQTRDSSYASPSWGGRVVERRLVKAYPTNTEYANNEDWEAFISVFEGGGILYCHMAFEDLLNMRGQLEELGFPCKSVADGLWLQTLLRQQVLTIAADTCKNCCLVYPSCNCRPGFAYSHARIPAGNYHRDEQERNSRAASYPPPDSQGGVTSPMQGRVHVRGSMDGLAGIGRGTTFGPPGTPWPPSRFVFSRVPVGGPANRCGQQSLGNDQIDGRFDVGAMDLPTQCANGLTAVVGLSQGLNSGIPVHSDQSGRLDDQPLFSRVVGDPPGGTNLSNANAFKVEPLDLTQEWEAYQSSSISLDLQTPLRNFPPFRFGIEFDDVRRLADGQSKHSSEAFYAGSLWKVSVQAFNDEDPRGRRTLGLFLHRRKSDDCSPCRKVSLYTDSREKVMARYQLICPAKRGVMILGNLTQAGTLLPKAPKGWGWRTAFLFDELADLLQGSSLRVAAVVQLV